MKTLEDAKNIVNAIGNAISKLYVKKEIEKIDNKISEYQEKRNALAEKNNVKLPNKKGNDDNIVLNVALCINHEEVKQYMRKIDNVDNLVSYMINNNYDTTLIDVAKDLSIDVVDLRYNVTETTKRFLKRVNKGNVKELNNVETSYFINHLIVLYATKHKYLQHNVKYQFGNRAQKETLLNYATFRKGNVKDINVAIVR